MSSEFDTFSNDGGYPEAMGGSTTTLPFDDGYIGCEHLLPSQRFDALTVLSLSDGSETTVDHLPPSQTGFGFHTDDVPIHNHDGICYAPSVPASSNVCGFSLLESYFMIPHGNGTAYDVVRNGDILSSDGPILPDPDDMQREVGFLLREWHRENVILLDEKERKEKESRNQIIDEAKEYIRAFYEKRKLNWETNKSQNREREKIFLTNQGKFHANADKNYWKAISELIPREISIIEKRGKKEQENKPSIPVIRGPKPGKLTELSRMRQILVRLEHTPPLHMKPAPPFVSSPSKDDIQDGAAFARKKPVQPVKAPELIATA